MGQLSEADRPAAFGLIEKVASGVTQVSTTTAEMYGVLGRQELDPPGMLSKVEAQAFKAKPYTPDNPNVVAEPAPGLAIVVGPGPWLAALAEYGRTRRLPDRDVALLREHVADPSLRDLIVPTLVRQEPRVVSSELASSWVQRLANLARDFARTQCGASDHGRMPCCTAVVAIYGTNRSIARGSRVYRRARA